uniref:Viral peptide n=1 Tax=Fowl adenovirus A serotype 1 (strain CELO / Phelps) TaxID=10553 RepID=Q96588_ADEG1|nr:viral peptide [Fowl aviadenovirus 1]
MGVVCVHGVLTQIGQLSHIHKVRAERHGPEVVIAQELLVVDGLVGTDGVVPDQRVRPVSGPGFALLCGPYGPAARGDKAGVVTHVVLRRL